MKVEWNKVTWYSKLFAVVVFAAVFWIGFYAGKQSLPEQNIVIAPSNQ